ncbi:MAG: NAD(P)H-dependent oxidoreductase subunit E [Candidatus Baltobacteraceae bacterium]
MIDKGDVGGDGGVGVDGGADFAAVLERVRAECLRLISQYPDSRSALLPILHEFQNELGWVSPEAMAACAEMLGLPMSIVESTASFYTLFFKRPVGKYMLQPCRGVACIVSGAESAMAHFRERLGVQHMQTTADGVFSYEEVECLAACDRPPCMQVNLEFVYDLTPEKIDAMVDAMRAGTYDVPPRPQTAKPGRDWEVASESGRKALGARGVSNPNAPGGIGDASGLRMLERLERDPEPVRVRPTRERLVVDGAAVESELTSR